MATKLVGSPASCRGFVCAVGEDGSFYNLSQNINGSWTPWNPNPGIPPGEFLLPSPTVSISNLIDIQPVRPIVVGKSGAAYSGEYHDRFSWETLKSLGMGLLPSPVAVADSDDIQHLFIVTGDHSVLYSEGNNSNGFIKFGGFLTAIPSPGAAFGLAGQLHGFVCDSATGGVWDVTVYQGSSLISPGSFPNIVFGSPAVAPNQKLLLEVFAVGSDGALWHVWETLVSGALPAKTKWSAWFSHGTPGGTQFQTAPAIALDSLECLEVFCIGNGELWSLQQTEPSNGWGAWTPFNSSRRPTPGFADRGWEWQWPPGDFCHWKRRRSMAHLANAADGSNFPVVSLVLTSHTVGTRQRACTERRVTGSRVLCEKRVFSPTPYQP
jgi:hypothetical protein